MPKALDADAQNAVAADEIAEVTATPAWTPSWSACSESDAEAPMAPSASSSSVASPSSWKCMHSPNAAVTWHMLPTGDRPLSSSLPDLAPAADVTSMPGITLWSAGRRISPFMSMSNSELDAYYENDWDIKMKLAVHRTDVRTRLTQSTPSLGRVATPKLDVPPPRSVSAWRLQGKPGRGPGKDPAQRRCWNDHALAPKLARNDHGGGPGEYSYKLMRREVWAPQRGEFSKIGKRTKCTVSELDTTWRWQYDDGIRRRMQGVCGRGLDSISRPAPQLESREIKLHGTFH